MNNPAIASTSSGGQGGGQNATGTVPHPHQGTDGYYSGMQDEDILGSRSDELLMNRVLETTAALASRSFESFGRRRPVYTGQTLESLRSRNLGLLGSSLSTILEEDDSNTFDPRNNGEMNNVGTVNRTARQRASILTGLRGSSEMDRDWRAPTPSSSIESNQPSDFFLQQVREFPKLPLHIHKEVYQTSGNHILNHFDVNLVRVQNGTVVGSTDSVAVFTTKPESGQSWLMVYMKKKFRNDNDSKSALRFNRLLTPNLKYMIMGRSTIEVDSSKVNSSECIKFIFNFESVETAAEFVQLLEELKNQPWNVRQTPRGFGTIGYEPAAPRGFSTIGFEPAAVADAPRGFGTVVFEPVAAAAPPIRRNNLVVPPVSTGIPRGTGLQETAAPSVPSAPQVNISGTSAAPPAKPRAQGVRFVQNSAPVFVQYRSSFAPLAIGTLKILHCGDSYDKLILWAPGGDGELMKIMQHCIYKWNEIRIIPDRDEYGSEIGWNCYWTACAEIRGSIGLPKFHAFKLGFSSKEDANCFYNSFKTSVAVAEQIGCVPAAWLHHP